MIVNDPETLLKECQERANQGATCEDIVLYLHRGGATITESMKIVRDVCRLSLGEAKALVTAHPVWADVVSSADVLHAELENALQKEE